MGLNANWSDTHDTVDCARLPHAAEFILFFPIKGKLISMEVSGFSGSVRFFPSVV